VIQRTYNAGIAGRSTGTKCFYNEKWYNDIWFTGYSYGDENDYNCLACGQAGHTYKIYSTTLDETVARQWMTNIVNALYDYYDDDNERMNREYKGKMIGVMYAGGRWYASHSGGHQHWIYEALPKGVKYLNHSDNEDVTTWGGSTISRGDFADCQIPFCPGILQCAGAKLARYVASFHVSAPIYMTEIWADPNQTHDKYIHAAITESCNTCREQIATIMCPHTPQKITEMMYRESKRERVFPRYTRGESRKVRTFQLLEDVVAYTEPWPTRMLGFTLKKGAKIQVNDFSPGYYRVKLLSGWATYHRFGQQTQTIVPETSLVPSMYVDANAFNRSLMDLEW